MSFQLIFSKENQKHQFNLNSVEAKRVYESGAKQTIKTLLAFSDRVIQLEQELENQAVKIAVLSKNSRNFGQAAALVVQQSTNAKTKLKRLQGRKKRKHVQTTGEAWRLFSFQKGGTEIPNS